MGLRDERGAQLGVVLQVHGSKLDLCTLDLCTTVHRRQQAHRRDLTLLRHLPPALPAPERVEQPPWGLETQALKDATPRRRDCGAAWLLLQADPSPCPLGDWCELVCGGSAPVQLAACWLWLQGPQLMFRLRQEGVGARPPDDLRRLRLQRRRDALEQERRNHWHGLLRARQPIAPERLGHQQRLELDLLLAWASGHPDDPLPPDLRRALQAAHCEAEGGAIRHLLVDLGQWDPHRLPSLEASPWRHGFSPELEREAVRLLERADDAWPGDAERHDLTHQRAVTIDDDDTRDIDDGLALEQRADGSCWIWIHIADPGRLVEAGGPLDLEARKRASSLYLARGTLPMFPEALATGPFSLRAGLRNPAWSLAVRLDGEGAVAAYEICRSWVRPAYRLSYDDADALIDLAPPQERDLAVLNGLLERRRRWRVARGALQMDQPEGRLRLRDGLPELQITDPSPARQLVAEAMILMGAVVAGHGLQHGLALPFRSQMPAELPPPAELEALPHGPVRHAAIRRCLSRGHTAATASAHFSLGLTAYVQATSPIRRYADLVVQRQLLAWQRGTPPLDTAAMQALLEELEEPLRQGIQISRDDQRHWQQVWFQSQASHQWRGLFLRWLRPQDQLGLVHLEALAMDVVADCPASSQPGDALLVRVQQVDPLRDLLRLAASS